jgi:hypothetical protein
LLERSLGRVIFELQGKSERQLIDGQIEIRTGSITAVGNLISSLLAARFRCCTSRSSAAQLVCVRACVRRA